MKRLIVATLRGFFGGLGRLAGRFAAPVNARVLCVFATPDLGGAERYHADIVAAVAGARPAVWFTEEPRNALLLDDFKEHADVVFLKVRRRIAAYFMAGFMGSRIRRGRVETLFGCFSHFFYDMLPHVGSTRCVDLTHNTGLNFDTYTLRHVPKLDVRIVVHAGLPGEIEARYAAAGLSPALIERLRVIGPGVDVPDAAPAKAAGSLQVLYVGRASPEKRVHLVGQLASMLAANGIDARVRLAGVPAESIAEGDRAHCAFDGTVTDREALNAIYDAAHVLVLTSEREGFPLVLIESMARGVVPVCTAVGGIPAALAAARLGAVTAAEPAPMLEQMAASISRLASDRALLAEQSRAARAYARGQFSRGVFADKWRQVLLGGSGLA